MGVDVRDYKAKAFLVSLHVRRPGRACSTRCRSARVAPDSFGLDAVGAVPRDDRAGRPGLGGGLGPGRHLRQRAAPGLPAVRRLAAVHRGPRRSPGIVASQAAAFLYGAAIVLVVLFEPGGLAGLARRLAAPRPCTRCCVRGRTRCRSGPDHHAGASRLRQPEETTNEDAHEARSGRARVGRHGAGGVGLQHQGARTRSRRRQDGVKVGRGVDGTTIQLGALTDLTGVFAALGKDITNAQALYWKSRTRRQGLRQVHRQARR